MSPVAAMRSRTLWRGYWWLWSEEFCEKGEYMRARGFVDLS
jgi:hypothetical protein